MSGNDREEGGHSIRSTRELRTKRGEAGRRQHRSPGLSGGTAAWGQYIAEFQSGLHFGNGSLVGSMAPAR